MTSGMLLRRAWNALRQHRSRILKRLAIYLILLIAISPVFLVFRTQIYTRFLSRFDKWTYSWREDGVPIIDYGYQAGVYVGPQIAPRVVANAAISYYEQAMSGNATAAACFNATIRWLLENRDDVVLATEDGPKNATHWFHDFAIWDLPVGWYSSMVDAKAINALALYYGIYHDESVLEVCERIVTSFEVPVEQGGDLLVLDDGTSWYPEYIVPPSIDPSYSSPLVLNGFLFALHHLYQANLVLNMSRLTKVFNLGVVAAASNLYKYDLPYNWTRYHLAYPVKLAPLNYQKIHVDLTGKLYEYTGVTIFQYYHNKWSGYKTRPLFVLDELLNWEVAYYGIVVASIVLGILVLLDIVRWCMARLFASHRSSTSS